MKYIALILFFYVELLTAQFALAQSFDISLSFSGSTEPGSTITVTMSITCNDSVRCRLGTYPNPNASGLITVTGNATPTSLTIPGDINRFGFFNPRQTKNRNFNITLTGSQGDIVTITAFADGYCRANDSGTPPPDTREINCDDTETLDIVTTPVTLSHFSALRTGNKLDIDWGTSSELFNVGFQLWGLDAIGSWHRLHDWLIKSGSGNAVEPQSYRKQVQIPSSIDQLMAIGISSLDSDGSEHYYGPFEVGQAYGELGTLEPIAWDDVRAELDARMIGQGYMKDRVMGYRKVAPLSENASSNTSEEVLEYQVSESGIYRILGSQLPESWQHMTKHELALIDATGTSVVRYIKTRGEEQNGVNTLGSSGEIYFYGQSPNESEGLYSNKRVYRLVRNPALVLKAQRQSQQGNINHLSQSYMEYSEVEPDSTYILNSALDDPWVDGVVVSYADQPGGYAVSVPIESDGYGQKGAVYRFV